MDNIIRVVLAIVTIFAFNSSFLYAADTPNVERMIETYWVRMTLVDTKVEVQY